MMEYNSCTMYMLLNLIYNYEPVLYTAIKDRVKFKFKTKEQLKEAIDKWCKPHKNSQALGYYGYIWNTELITDI